MDFGGPIPDPPRPPRPDELSRALLDAILKGSADDARKVFDRAFWEKVAFKPDGYHLLQAAMKGDRPMVTLLTSYGAAWTEEEAKLARTLVRQEQWQAVEGPLKNGGVRTQFTPQELRRIDIMTAVAWAARSVSEAKARGMKDSDASVRILEDTISAGLIDTALGGQMDKARTLLLYRNPKLGDGREEFPLDLNREFNAILAARPVDGARLALEFLDAFTGAGLAVRPVELKALEVILAPGLVPELEKRKMLSQNQPQARSEVIGVWTALQERTEFAGHVIELPPEEVRQRQEEMRRIAGTLFKKGSVTEAEADAFVSLHQSRAKFAPHALAAAEKELLGMGFFEGAAWTPARLRRLAAAPVPDASVTETFNKMALRQEVAAAFIGRPVTPQTLEAALEAHRTGAWQANAQATGKIVDYLATRVKKDRVPEDVMAALKTLARGGADFGGVQPAQYLGKSAPGLAKALLDAGAVPPESFDLDAVARKYGGHINLIIPPGKKDYETTEFICQLILEIAEPHKYVKHRGDPGISYQKLFMKEWVENLSRRPGGTITYRRRTPGTGSTGPR